MFLKSSGGPIGVWVLCSRVREVRPVMLWSKGSWIRVLGSMVELGAMGIAGILWLCLYVIFRKIERRCVNLYVWIKVGMG